MRAAVGLIIVEATVTIAVGSEAASVAGLACIGVRFIFQQSICLNPSICRRICTKYRDRSVVQTGVHRLLNKVTSPSRLYAEGITGFWNVGYSPPLEMLSLDEIAGA